MLTVTVAQLTRAAPAGDPKIIAAIAATSGAVFSKYALGSRNRALGFLSTCLEESQFRTLSENLNYSAERAHEVFPREFPTVASAEPYAMNPQAFGDKVYGGRLGNIGPNAGWLYRGQGLDQVTGESNFKLLARLTGLDLVNHPELVTSPGNMLGCAAALFVQYPGILSYCDRGAWTYVWALVGTGRATGPVINLAAHEAALAALQKAIPALIQVADPASPPVVTPAPLPSPVAHLDAIRATVAPKTATAADGSILDGIEKAIKGWSAT
jgi:putative chitinase